MRSAAGIVLAALSVVAAAFGGEKLPWAWEGGREVRSGDEWVVDLEGAPERVEVWVEGGEGSFAVDEASWDGVWNGTPLGSWESGTDGWAETALAPDGVTRHLRFRSEGGAWVLKGVRVAGRDGEVRVVFDQEDGFVVEEGADGVEIRAQVENGGGGWFGEDAWECDEGAGWGHGAVFRVDTGATGWHWARVRAGCDGSGTEVFGVIRWRVGAGAGEPPTPPEKTETPSVSPLEKNVLPRVSVADYYAGCRDAGGVLLTGTELKAALCGIVNTGTKTNSYGGGLDTMLRTLDACPTNSAMLQCIYLQRGITGFNKEHIWAQSHGIDGKSPAYSDLHHLRACDITMNTTRGNLDFDDCRGAAGAKEKNGCWYTERAWEPPDAAKGDVARAMLYMDVRYEDGTTPVGDLRLVEATGTGTESNIMGRLSTLLEWNELDPPDDFERRRNELIYSKYQGNRNPFVDHPEWVRAVFDPGNWEEGELSASVAVSGLEARQRYPWNGLVDVDYVVEVGPPGAGVAVAVEGEDRETGETVEMRSLSGDGAAGPVRGGERRLTWDLGADAPELASDSFAVRMKAWLAGSPYLVVDLSGGCEAVSWPVERLDAVPEGGWTEEHKTSKLVLRRVPAGSFLMGSPAEEAWRRADERQHRVTLTEAYYIGVFEVTQRQWELVMGDKPSYYQGAQRPVEWVSYERIRGSRAGAGWPESRAVDAESFMGVLRAKTGLAFDLPTEAQWERACRAGTATALNSGKGLSRGTECPNLSELGRYCYNGGLRGTNGAVGGYTPGHTTAGSYRANAWGLHDMHGNVWEWCRDWYGDYGDGMATDPVGPSEGTTRVVRGGGWYGLAEDCRSAGRHDREPGYARCGGGFRVACAAGKGDGVVRAGWRDTIPLAGWLGSEWADWSAVETEWKVVSGPGLIQDGALSFTGMGEVVVAASLSGSGGVVPCTVAWTVAVEKATAEVSFEGAAVQEAGRVGGWRARTVPEGLAVRVTYDGQEMLPTEEGWHKVEATVEDDLYRGDAKGTLAVTAPGRYLAVHLSGGTDTESWPWEVLESMPEDGWTAEDKTSRLVLRRVEPGTFAMGSPAGEIGRSGGETLHDVTLEKGYWIGVFETTQRQLKLATGKTKVQFPGDEWPANCVSYNEARGTDAGAGWPADSAVDAGSIVAALRQRTGLAFDLPTEAEWEYACRAGTATALNGGRDLEGTWREANMAEAGRYRYNSGFSGASDGKGGVEYGTAPVGSYLPNAWGMFDMHGNVSEWCRDWYGAYGAGAVVDPSGTETGTARVVRGGNWMSYATDARSAKRSGMSPRGYTSGTGLRLACYGKLQEVRFEAVGPQMSNEQVELVAAATSGGEVTFEVVSGPGVLDGNVLSFIGGGAVVVRATQTGDDEWAAAFATLMVEVEEVAETRKYLVVDLDGGTGAESWPVEYLDAPPKGGFNTDAYKTTKVVLRRISSGHFTMGSPQDETGRQTNEVPHEVVLTEPFYIGLFEVTQKQWELVMGTKPAARKGDTRPVERVSHHDIRGSWAGAKWPESDEVDMASFMGKLRAKTTGIRWDLPTEAQWEYACRAGTATALNSGKELTDTYACTNLSALGRYAYNQSADVGGYAEHTAVGSYSPNAWGLFDMHGNVREWCLDWWQANLGTAEEENPVGVTDGTERVIRGGGWDSYARHCRSASRNDRGEPSISDYTLGFRIAARIEE